MWGEEWPRKVAWLVLASVFSSVKWPQKYTPKGGSLESRQGPFTVSQEPSARPGPVPPSSDPQVACGRLWSLRCCLGAPEECQAGAGEPPQLLRGLAQLGEDAEKLGATESNMLSARVPTPGGEFEAWRGKGPAEGRTGASTAAPPRLRGAAPVGSGRGGAQAASGQELT